DPARARPARSRWPHSRAAGAGGVVSSSWRRRERGDGRARARCSAGGPVQPDGTGRPDGAHSLSDDQPPPQMDRKSSGISESTDREPKELDADAFSALFRDACRKCFSRPLDAPITETESHRLSVEIAESTGLEIGWKSL